MKYFTVPAIGIGTEDDPIRPDLPGDPLDPLLHGCVGQPHELGDGSFLIAAPNNTLIAEGGAIVAIADEDLDAECVTRGLDPDDVRTWWLRGGPCETFHPGLSITHASHLTATRFGLGATAGAAGVVRLDTLLIEPL